MTTPLTTLQLGDFVFEGAEVPESLPFGGEQALAVHRMVGGARIIDAMGADPAPIEWSGIFLGDVAVQRARYLDNLRKKGGPLLLTWSEFRYTVVIKSFQPRYDFEYNIPYRIVCEVVRDETTPVRTIASYGPTAEIKIEIAEAQDAAEEVNDDPLSDLMDGLDAAIKAVSDIANAAQSVIDSIVQPILAIQQRVQLLLASVSNTISNVTSLGGLIPGLSLGSGPLALADQIAAMERSAALTRLSASVNRIAQTVREASPGKTITVSGGTLFALASEAYNDPAEWSTIAKANGLTDPQITGVTTLVIPSAPSYGGGILSA